MLNKDKMHNCSMVVGPKFHFTKLNPTWNFKYFTGNLYDLFFKQMFHPFKIHI